MAAQPTDPNPRFIIEIITSPPELITPQYPFDHPRLPHPKKKKPTKPNRRTPRRIYLPLADDARCSARVQRYTRGRHGVILGRGRLYLDPGSKKERERERDHLESRADSFAAPLRGCCCCSSRAQSSGARSRRGKKE